MQGQKGYSQSATSIVRLSPRYQILSSELVKDELIGARQTYIIKPAGHGS